MVKQFTKISYENLIIFKKIMDLKEWNHMNKREHFKKCLMELNQM